MPGIVAIMSRQCSSEHRAKLEAMTMRIAYEPLSTTWTYTNKEIGVWIGWVGQTDSIADCWPIWNRQHDIGVLLSGEVFPDKERESLNGWPHHSWRASGRYIVQLYEETGPDFVKHLNGSYAGVLIDVKKATCFVFNDRYGMERVYFYEDKDTFYLASEAKALLEVLPQTRQLDQRSLGEFLTCNCVLQNRTLFSGISLVPGASLWTFSAGQGCQRHVYFTPQQWENQPQLSEPEYYERFRATWQQILPRYTQSGEQVALSLTGGVDSRLILAWMNPSSGSLPCYTWGSRYRDCFDVRLARRIAAICGQSHETIPVDGSFFAEFPKLAERAVWISDGCKDVTGSIDLYVQPRAYAIAPVRLSGLYGNESLRRKIAFKPVLPDPGIFTADVQRLGQDASVTYANELHCQPVSFSVFKQAPWFAAPSFIVQRSQVKLRTPYLDNDLVALAYQAPPEATNLSFFLRLIREGNPALANIATDRGFNLVGYTAVKQLRRWYYEFTFKAEYAYNDGMPNWLAKLDSTMAPLRLERLFLGRHKIDHFRTWYRNELAEPLKEILLDSKALGRPYLLPDRLEKILADHVKGVGNYTFEINQILSLELVYRHLLERA